MRPCNSLLKLSLLWIVGQTLTGCQAGVEGSGWTPPPVTFTGDVVGNGQITGLGSIFVGGIEYSLDHASIRIDGRPGSASQLIVGQIVTVNGKFGDGPSTAQASTVNYEPDLIGPISAIDSAHRQITVLGQQVSIDDDKAPTIIDTSINPASFEGLVKGIQVEISGFTNAQGVLSARRITAQAAGSAYAVNGVVARIDQSAKTFSVRALGIDFTGADLGAVTGGALKNGDTVRVEGVKFNAAGTLVASKISPHSIALPGAAGDTAIVEGWITRYVSDANFDVNGHHVVGPPYPIIPSTNGDPSQLRLDQFVMVFGKLRGDGGVDALEINVIKDIWANITLDVCTLADGCSKATQLMIDGIPMTTASFQSGDLATSYNYFWPDYSKFTPFKNATFPGAQAFERKLIVVEHTLRGPLEALDLDTGTLRIMGQNVVTGVLDTYINGKPGGSDNSYWRDQKSLRSFTVGQMMEVSGHETAYGRDHRHGNQFRGGEGLSRHWFGNGAQRSGVALCPARSHRRLRRSFHGWIFGRRLPRRRPRSCDRGYVRRGHFDGKACFLPRAADPWLGGRRTGIKWSHHPLRVARRFRRGRSARSFDPRWHRIHRLRHAASQRLRQY